MYIQSIYYVHEYTYIYMYIYIYIVCVYIYTRIQRALRARRGSWNHTMGLYYLIILLLELDYGIRLLDHIME